MVNPPTFFLIRLMIPVRVSTSVLWSPSRGTPSLNISLLSVPGSHKWRRNIATYALQIKNNLHLVTLKCFFHNIKLYQPHQKYSTKCAIFNSVHSNVFDMWWNITSMEADVQATSSHLVCFNIAEENKGNAEKHRVMQVGDSYHHGYFSRKKIIFLEHS